MHPEDERDCTLSRLETLMVFFSEARLARTATSLYWHLIKFPFAIIRATIT